MKAFLDKLRWFFAGYRHAVHIPVFCFFGLFIFFFSIISVIPDEGGIDVFLLGGTLRCFFTFIISFVVTLALALNALVGTMLTTELYDENVFPKVFWERSATESGIYAVVPWKTSLYLTFLFLGGTAFLYTFVVVGLCPILLLRRLKPS